VWNSPLESSEAGRRMEEIKRKITPRRVNDLIYVLGILSLVHVPAGRRQRRMREPMMQPGSRFTQ
jgi:hypothetical protein